MLFRPYDPEKDRLACQRIWQEVTWMQENQGEMFDVYLSAAKALVAEIDGSAECLVITCPGSMRYLDEDLSFSIVGGVSTSRIARRQKLAGRLTALAIANDAADGYHVSGLCMFEQGYYDKLGFGTGSCEHWFSFDPNDLMIKQRCRVPRRITRDDWQAVHASRMARYRGHGSINALSPSWTCSEMMDNDKAFGLGYFDGPDGELTHHLWIIPDGSGHGPFKVRWSAWQTKEQFLELLALLKSLGDQLFLVRMNEPQGIQLQDLLHLPMKNSTVRKDSKLEVSIAAQAYWQVRICNLPGCLSKTHLDCRELQFNLELHDPIENYLDENAPWHGCGGEYLITLGSESRALRGSKPLLPTLKASVGAFTRLWLGVQSATGLSITDDLSGPPELLRALDRALCLPTPHLGWDI